MKLFPLRYPSGPLTFGSVQDQMAVTANLAAMREEFDLAVVAYNYFRATRKAPRETGPAWRERAERAERRFEELQERHGFEADLHDRAREEIRNEDLAKGVPPEEYELKLPRLYAEVFIVAVHRFLVLENRLENILRALGLTEDDLRPIQPYRDRLNNYFNNVNQVKGVRDTMHHLDERLSFSGGKQGPFPDPVFLIAMTDSSFSASIANGSVGRVEISSAALVRLQAGFQGILEELPWGHPVHWEHHPY